MTTLEPKTFSLPDGATYFHDENGNKVCTGSQMGRCNILPSDFPNEDYPHGNKQKLKLRMIRLPFVDGCYDKWGAYWGSPANIYCAFVDGIRVFVRANGRYHAKEQVRVKLPNATFYR